MTPVPPSRLSRARGRVLAGTAVGAAVLAATTGLAAPASAATHARGVRPIGHVRAVHLSHGRLSVAGWTLDRSRPAASTVVVVKVNGHTTARIRANRRSPGVDRTRHVRGRHDFRWSGHRRHVHRVEVIARSAHRGGRSRRIAQRRFSPVPDLARRIIAQARRFVGVTPYVWGGTTPHGFDCSGYAQYVYRHAGAPHLPRTAEQQRRADRRITRAQARPGDEIFYLRHGSAYHVAIYAGHGMQYSADNPRDDIRYEHIWGRVRYGTNWH